MTCSEANILECSVNGSRACLTSVVAHVLTTKTTFSQPLPRMHDSSIVRVSKRASEQASECVYHVHHARECEPGLLPAAEKLPRLSDGRKVPFCKLFEVCSKLTDVENLAIPAVKRVRRESEKIGKESRRVPGRKRKSSKKRMEEFKEEWNSTKKVSRRAKFKKYSGRRE
jgi:hypothetical protein